MRFESKPVKKSVLTNIERKVDNLQSNLQTVSLNSLNQSSVNGDINEADDGKLI